MRHDLLLLFAFWHAYHYAYVALWEEFGPTVLYSAYFHVFPDEKLMGRPNQNHSATFFTWCRLAYPIVREKLNHGVTLLKARVLGWELGEIKQIRAGNREELQTNPHLAIYVQLLNLQSLFEFCIPCIQDYGAALKGQDWHIFLDCYLRTTLFRE